MTRLQRDILQRIQFQGLRTPDHYDLFLDPGLMRKITLAMSRPFKGRGVTKVLGIDAVGFILAALVAERLGAGLVLVRKGGKIPSPAYRVAFTDYSKQKKTLEIKKNAISRKDRLLIVDDWAETGLQLQYTIKLAKKFKPNIIGISLVINEMNPRQRKAISRYRVQEIIDLESISKPSW